MCAPLLGFGPVLKQPRKSQSHSPWSAVTPHPQGPFPVQASIPSMLSPGQAFPTWLSTLPRWLQCQGQSWRRTGDPDTQGVYVCVHSITFSKVSWQYLLLEEVQGEKLGCLIKRETHCPRGGGGCCAPRDQALAEKCLGWFGLRHLLPPHTCSTATACSLWLATTTRRASTPGRSPAPGQNLDTAPCPRAPRSRTSVIV